MSDRNSEGCVGGWIFIFCACASFVGCVCACCELYDASREHARLRGKITQLETELHGEYVTKAKCLLDNAIDRGEYSYQLDPKTGKIALRLAK